MQFICGFAASITCQPELFTLVTKRCCLAACLLLQGIITHVTDVKPLASVIAYIDRDSGTEVSTGAGGAEALVSHAA